MDDTHLRRTVTAFLAFLVLTRLQASVQAQDCESIALSAASLWRLCVCVTESEGSWVKSSAARRLASASSRPGRRFGFNLTLFGFSLSLRNW